MQKLITAHRQQIQIEESRYLITKSQKEMRQQDMRNTAKKISDILHRQEQKKNELERGMSKMEKLKAESLWDTEALEAWEDTLKKRDEDNERLKKFTQEDERKMSEMEAKRRNCQMDLISRKKIFDQMVTEIMNFEQITERMVKTFRSLKDQRDILIKHWKETVQNLKQRDDDINRTSNEIFAANDIISRKKAYLDEQNQFLKNEQNNNKELELEIAECRAIASRFKRQLDDINQTIALRQNEVRTFNFNIRILFFHYHFFFCFLTEFY